MSSKLDQMKYIFFKNNGTRFALPLLMLRSKLSLILIQLCGRSLRVDHVENYRLPKHLLEKEEQVETIITKNSATGHAYQGKELANDFNLDRGQDLFAPPSSSRELSTLIDTSSAYESDIIDNESSVQRKERKRRRKEGKHQKRSQKEDRRRELHRSTGSRDHADHDYDAASRKNRKRKHRDR